MLLSKLSVLLVVVDWINTGFHCTVNPNHKKTPNSHHVFLANESVITTLLFKYFKENLPSL